MKSLLIVVMLTVCAAALEDLTGKMLSFPQETKTDHVKLFTTKDEFKAITVCLRSFTDLSRNHGLFSLATPSFANGFLIFKKGASDQVELNVRNKGTTVYGQEYMLNTWQSVCASWDGKTGLEQDSHGGGFDLQQAFIGMIADVHMWDFILSPCEIQRFVDDLNFSPGNVINWRALQYEISSMYPKDVQYIPWQGSGVLPECRVMPAYGLVLRISTCAKTLKGTRHPQVKLGHSPQSLELDE
ncbi:Serum amyloid P-component [Merluccius polli]|uniref:Pentraxin family member n=1 Tax=Merluccius polli TaxID=89951 RepID=A0AA47MHK5_MERPO|nr:Serum amyloid P-component [Merluccius polli]